MIIFIFFIILNFSNNFKRKKNRTLIYALCVFTAGGIGYIAWVMVSTHPYQGTYFNALASNPSKRYEKDFWGVSYRSGLQYILDHDTSQKIVVSSWDKNVKQTLQIFTSEERNRFRFTDHIEFADYYLSNFRWEYRIPIDAPVFFTARTPDAVLMTVHKIPAGKFSRTVMYSTTNDFEKSYPFWANIEGTKVIELSAAHSATHACSTDSVNYESSRFFFPVKSIPALSGKLFLRATLWKYVTAPDFNSVFVVTAEAPGSNPDYQYALHTNHFRDTETGVWRNVVFEAELPRDLPKEDYIYAFIQNTDGGKIYIDDFTVELIEVTGNN